MKIDPHIVARVAVESRIWGPSTNGE